MTRICGLRFSGPLFLFFALVLSSLAVPAHGDEARDQLNKFNQRMDRARETIEEVEKALADPNLSDAALRALRGRMEPLPADFQEIIDTLTPRLAAIDARLKELAPPETKPAEKPPEPEKAPEAAKPASPAPTPPQRPASKPAQKPPPGKTGDAPAPEPAPDTRAQDAAAEAAKAELAEQRGLFEGTDASLKRARSLLVETRQIIVAIVARQRALFTKTLFLRTDGLFSPALWRPAIADAPLVARAAVAFLSDRGENFVNRVKAGATYQFIAFVLAIFFAIPPALLLSRRVVRRVDADASPTPLRKAAAAAWTTLVVASVPVAAIGALGFAFESFDLLDAALEPLWRRIVEAVARVAATYAIARGALAPAHPQWRLVDPGDRLARLLVRLATLAAIVLSIARLAEQIEETVQASLPVVIVTRGVSVMLIALLVSYAVAALPRARAMQEGETASSGRDWIAVARFVGLTSLLLLFGVCAAGYVTFANFVILYVGWLAAIIAVVYVAVTLLRGGVEVALEPASFVGRHLISGLGLRREQLAPIAVLLAGLITLIGLVAALLMAVASLGYESGDFLAHIRSAFFSFHIGGVALSPLGILEAILIFTLALLAAQAFRRWMDTRFLPLTRLDMGLRNSISSTLGYAGFILAAGMALSHLGLGFEKLAIVAGALSVGIGFGLQSIVNNFVSGLILLWERAIRVGDWVVIGDEQGYVKRINVRSTEIETFDRATMIVPNSNLVAGVVKNWLRGDKVGRIKVGLTPPAGVEPEQIREIMIAAARAQEGVLRIPAPQVMFLGMEAASFRFELWCYVEDVEKSQRVRSDLYFDLHRRLTEAGITAKGAASPPPSPTIVQFPSLDKVAAAAAASMLALAAGATQVPEEGRDGKDAASETSPGANDPENKG
ncbi:MAG: DUF3772 domain-containing protein [Methylocystis sp.]|nr:DUF3772 domain-containing protein [Methylocystis sp.]